MKKILLGLSIVFAFTRLSAQNNYSVTINLQNVVDDKLQVVCTVPIVDQNEIEFHMPKMVPGTYSIYDFGRFISNFKAFDKDGGELETDFITANRRLIKGAKNLASISYWVEDSYDTNLDNVIFEPAGTNIEDSLNFVLNTFGFVGYLDGMKDYNYELNIQHPTNMFGAAGLSKKVVHDSLDIYSAPNYFDLADGPIMYCEPDTLVFEVGGADVLISVYSPGDIMTAAFVKEQVQPTMEAQKAYLGGTLPVDNYAILIYLIQGRSNSGGFGALEHSYSSLFTLPEMNPAHLAQSLRDITAHEFFHIVTPLNIHSEEIGNFDFINPQMSKHLWLYEGTTEYAAGLAQVKYGEMEFQDYLKVLADKIKRSKKFKDAMPFTEMSKNCLDETKDQYVNVYQKGALIGLALDVRLRELSGGEYGVQNLMTDLAKEYGKMTSFKDDELFDKITELTYPEIREFFSTYVEGSTPLDYTGILNKVGVIFVPGVKKKELSLGHISFGVNEDNQMVINGIDHMNTFGKEMGYEAGDVIWKFDGVEIDIENYDEEFMAFKDRHQVGDKITAIVLRKDNKGKVKKLKLSAAAMEVDVKTSGSMELNYKATEEQLALRKAWVNK